MSSSGSDRAMNSEFFAMAMKVKSDFAPTVESGYNNRSQAEHLQYNKQYKLGLCKGSKSPEGNKTERVGG